jgi:hypothetical protein
MPAMALFDLEICISVPNGVAPYRLDNYLLLVPIGSTGRQTAWPRDVIRDKISYGQESKVIHN